MTLDYTLANVEKRALKLASHRRDILAAQSEQALDMILEAPSPATLVQSFPDQDLYFLMHKIGVHDFLPILAMATSAQWEYILDVDVWEGDRLDIQAMTQTFGWLFQADPKRLLRWIITEKPDFFEFYLQDKMHIHIREHDEWFPEDFDDYITLDDKFYFRFPDKPDSGASNLPIDAPELIEKMMRVLAEMDLSVFHGLLLETGSVLSAETEEEQFRLKNIRLAEKGFLPPHEAVGIYQPTDLSRLRKRPASVRARHVFDPDIPLPPQVFTQFIQGDDLFVKALEGLDLEFRFQLHSEIAALSNKIISADRARVREPNDVKKIIQKATAYLSLGLEVILQGDTLLEPARNLLVEYYLEDIFRTGSRAGIQLKTKAGKWYQAGFMKKSGLPLSFLGEKFLGVIGGLLLDRPLFYDNYQEGELYRHFKTLEEIRTTDQALDQIIHIDRILGELPLDITSFTQGVLTYKSLILTLWARNRLGLDTDKCCLTPIEVSMFRPFFADLFSSKKPGKIDDLKGHDLTLWITQTLDCREEQLPGPFLAVLADLILEIEQEYGTVDSKQVDPRFMPHFLLVPDELAHE